jgi:branched-chain amino acid transport system permease protein
MHISLQMIANGLAIGSVYGSIALGLVLIYRSTGVLNFAQGEMATFTTYIGWSFVVTIGMPYWIGFLLGVVVAFLLGALVERTVIRPVQNQPHLTVVIVTLGLFLLFNTLSLKFWHSTVRPFRSPFPKGSWHFANTYVSWVSIGIFGVSLLSMAFVGFIFRFTKVGLAMRAVTSNKTASALMGINNGRILSLGWGLATGVGAIAGMLAANRLLLDPNMMQGVLLYAFAAAVIGGLTSPIGAVLGGLIMGVTNSIVSSISWIGSDLSLAATFIVLVIILLIRPQGLFGRAVEVRV